MKKGKPALALIALGANLPFEGQAPEDTLRKAQRALESEGLVIQSFSKLFETPCFPAGAGPDYVNAAAVIEIPAELGAGSLLETLHRIEAQFGRKRVQRWGMRTLDIDLLAMGDSVLPDAGTQDRWRHLSPEAQARETPADVILPHPRLQDRAFVLVPLADVAPDWVHPRLGKTVRQMLADLPPSERQAVKLLGNSPNSALVKPRPSA